MVGIISARAARKRMRYETWYLLHFYTYLAIALSFSHQFANGDEFMSNKPARVVWSRCTSSSAPCWSGTGSSSPLLQMRRHSMRVRRRAQEAPGVVSLLIKGKQLGELGVEPGQFLRFRFLTRDLWWASNPYSLSAPVQPDLLRITVRPARRPQRRPRVAQAGDQGVRRGSVRRLHRRPAHARARCC